MRLLVSVRSAAEAVEAAAGGADLIDAKEPMAGALGPVGPETLAAIRAAVPGHPVSAALGDVTTEQQLRDTIRDALAPSPSPLAFIKLGFLGLGDLGTMQPLLRQVVADAGGRTGTAVVAVAYADQPTGAPAPERVLEAAAAAGVAGVLLDTAAKTSGSLLDHRSRAWLERWVADVRAAGCFSALAGGLGIEELQTVADVGPDVIGVRGAACDGDRNGRLSAERVALLRHTVTYTVSPQ